VTQDEMSEAQMYAWLSAELQRSRELDFSAAMRARRSRPEQCRLFSALLQGSKSGIWTVVQEQVFAPVRVVAVS
jgi:chromatin segregation and condensation protein Rec8/ScpA/Scc1 (kleisin family)